MYVFVFHRCRLLSTVVIITNEKKETSVTIILVSIVYATNIIVLTLLFLLLLISNILFLSIQNKRIKTIKMNLASLRIYHPFFLFLTRTKVKYDIILLVFVSFLSVFIDKSYDEPFAFIVTMLTSLYILYYEYINSQKKKINIFYTANNLKKLRTDTVFSLAIFSVIFLIIAIVLGALNKNFLLYSMYYFLTIISFSLSNYLVPINIEKKENKKIITFKDLTKSILLTILLLSLFLFIFTKYS